MIDYRGSRAQPHSLLYPDWKTCTVRGHDIGTVNFWHRCKWCGAWVRMTNLVEEREDEPPRAEQDPLDRAKGPA